MAQPHAERAALIQPCARVAGRPRRYLRAGTQGPALLLVHGFGVAAWHYERNLPGLAQHFQVYAIDLLGQGEAGAP